jgi:hypothetical protein
VDGATAAGGVAEEPLFPPPQAASVVNNSKPKATHNLEFISQALIDWKA